MRHILYSFQLFIASNILLGVGLITIGLAIFFLEWRYPGGFFGFAAQHPLLLTLLILWALILIALMLPTWIFVGRFFALDESDLKTYRIGSVSDTTANLFFRSPDMARGLVQGAVCFLMVTELKVKFTQLTIFADFFITSSHGKESKHLALHLHRLTRNQ